MIQCRLEKVDEYDHNKIFAVMGRTTNYRREWFLIKITPRFVRSYGAIHDPEIPTHGNGKLFEREH